MTNKVQISTLKAGDIFTFGGVEWVKLDGGTKGCISLTAKSIGNKAFDEDGHNNWEISSLRDWLNDEWFDQLDDALPSEGLNPFVTIVSDLTADDGMTNYGTCADFIALLSCDMRRKYRNIIPSINYLYWTLTPSSCNLNDEDDNYDEDVEYDNEYDECGGADELSWCVRQVIPAGKLLDGTCDFKGGVRPICKLKPETLVEPKGVDTI